MSIGYRDFVPLLTKRGFCFPRYENLLDIVRRANGWIATAEVQVINVETVVLAGNVRQENEASEAVSGWPVQYPGRCCQVVRIWYRPTDH